MERYISLRPFLQRQIANREGEDGARTTLEHVVFIMLGCKHKAEHI